VSQQETYFFIIAKYRHKQQSNISCRFTTV